jgi:TRAP transporter 4TM/12TM fusion protein
MPEFEKLSTLERRLFDGLAVFLLLFYSYSAVIRPVSTEMHRGIFVVITYLLILLVYRSGDGWKRWIDYLLMVVSIVTVGYWIQNFAALNYRAGAENQVDQLIAVAGTLLGIEIARRVIGWVFVLLGGALLLYGVYGFAMPDLIAHPGTSFLNLSTIIFFKADGVFGIMADVLATYVLLFVLFGSFLAASGAERFFIDWPLAAVGHRTGGPGKVSVIASGLFGSISGSAIANTVSTGTFTIPLMKRAGFKPHIAGAIEPAASVGGMFMPPVMGAGGFIMAELTGIPYSRIMLVALFPAIMYFFSVYVMVHYRAKMYGVTGDRSAVKAREVFRANWYYGLPIVLITIVMLMGYSPGFAAVVGLVSSIVISWFRPETRMGPRGILEGARAGAAASLKIGATVGVIGVIIAVLTFSGLTLSFADIVIELAGGSLLLTVLFIALASLILGMGVPVTAAYLITAVVAVPALTALGVNAIAAHMIVYWLSQDSNITPPVCIAAFAGATIAKADMWKTAFHSFHFAKYLYVGPLLFAYVPAFTLQGETWDIVRWFGIIVFGTWAFSYLLSFYWMGPLGRLLDRLRGRTPVSATAAPPSGTAGAGAGAAAGAGPGAGSAGVTGEGVGSPPS